ncbi:molecular chaperone GrpE heat shock protein [Serpentinimonas raichei]|uniref:Protein GrpE n=1 Tax=Serpentinimonas raichei TaxID=1458425 RepID=A0A060NJC3_9BURK|nr:nucleotide exchange factor GrpE [Serpentinimonas raichei]BAO81220.1 molecular chaperone GrpE heat shock protein [Serpentinimonas raichei]
MSANPDPTYHRPDRPDTADAPFSPEEAEAAAAADAALQDELSLEVERLQAQNTELAEQYLRVKAEMENLRRRTDEEVSKVRKFAVEGFAESLLPVLDSLEAGLAIQEATAQQIRDGAEATLKQLQSALARHKVQPIAPAAGSRFDPHQHQAIGVVAAPGQEPNSVVAVLQKGYLIAERVLRPAMVTVTAPK